MGPTPPFNLLPMLKILLLFPHSTSPPHPTCLCSNTKSPLPQCYRLDISLSQPQWNGVWGPLEVIGSEVRALMSGFSALKRLERVPYPFDHEREEGTDEKACSHQTLSLSKPWFWRPQPPELRFKFGAMSYPSTAVHGILLGKCE